MASAADMERLFADIPLDEVTTSMTINAPAATKPCFTIWSRIGMKAFSFSSVSTTDSRMGRSWERLSVAG